MSQIKEPTTQNLLKEKVSFLSILCGRCPERYLKSLRPLFIFVKDNWLGNIAKGNFQPPFIVNDDENDAELYLSKVDVYFSDTSLPKVTKMN